MIVTTADIRQAAMWAVTTGGAVLILRQGLVPPGDFDEFVRVLQAAPAAVGGGWLDYPETVAAG